MRLVTRVIASVRQATRPGFARSAGILASGTVLAYALGVLTVPIVSRLYHPQDFGEFALITSVAAVVAALTSLGMQSAIVQAATDEDSQRILAVGLAAAAALATLIVGVGFALSRVTRLLDSSLPYAVAYPLVWLLGILMCANGYLSSYANRRGANRVLFTNSLIGAGATLLITLPLGFLGTGAAGLIAGSVGALVVGNVQMVLRLRPFHRRPSVANARKVFRENRDFLAFQYPANLVETVSAQAPRQLLSLMFGTTAVGLYAMTDKMLGIPLRLVGAPVGTVYYREASQRYAAGKELNSFTIRLIATIMAVAYLPIVVVVLWGGPLFGWLLGMEWAQSGAIASILIVQYLFMLTRTCDGNVRVVVGLQSVNLAMSAVRLVVEVGALVGGGLVTGDVFDTLVCYSVASTLFYIIDMTVTFRAIGRSHWRYLTGALVYFASIACLWIVRYAL